MKKTLRFLVLGTLPFLSILIIIIFFNIIKLDLKYAHKSMLTYQNPFNWFEYKIKAGIVKLIINYRDIYKPGLNQKRIYLDEQKQNQLLIDIPRSTKIWQRGFHFDKSNNIKPMQARFRGDNPQNWMFEKKHWRMKVNKKDIINQQRYFDYLPFNFNKYFSGKIASEIDILSPNFKLIELYVNDISQGVYVESENLNESFLRRKKIMPVNMYKTEQILDESILALESNFYNSPGVTSKSAVFNQMAKDDKSDLIFFLELIRLSNNDNKYFVNLFDTIGVDKWALFAAYQILTQNFHNDNTHNLRLVIDPWSGHFYPLAYDPLIGNLNIEDFNLNYSSNDLLLLLNQSSKFQELKLKKIYEILNSKKINELIEKHNDIEKTLMISEKRDVELLVKKYNFFKLLKILIDKDYIDKERMDERIKFLNTYKRYLRDLNLYLTTKPDGSWKKNKKGFEIVVKKNLPISNLKIFFDNEIPEWISLDLNENNKIDKAEEKFKFYPKNNYFLIPYNFYANRLDYRKKSIHLSHINLSTLNTRFRFISSKNTLPYKIEFEDIFLKKTYLLSENDSFSVPASRFNIPINNQESLKELIKLSGTYEIKENIIFDQDVKIEAGTVFNLHKDKNLIFKGKVTAIGKKNFPIIFQKKDNYNWGTIALQGNNTSGSILDNIIFDGGTGFDHKNLLTKDEFYYSIGNVKYTSSLSVHNTNNIKLKNITIKNNLKYDDALHIIYSKNVILENFKINNAFGDAIDIDMSKKIILRGINIEDSKNDAIDLMESSVILEKSNLFGSEDKAISVGENSFIEVKDSNIANNNIGIATKDGSFSILKNLSFENNDYHLKNYNKNWRYGDGGLTIVNDSKFDIIKNNIDILKLKYEEFEIDEFSSLVVNNSNYKGQIVNEKFLSKKNKLSHLKKLKKLN